jgi:hypothetical protein
LRAQAQAGRTQTRPFWYRAVWRTSDLFRRLVSASPGPLKRFMCDVIALTVYWPLSRIAKLGEKLGLNADRMLLGQYRNMSRFGTRLEQRFTRAQIEDMMRAAGLERIRFSDGEPYWCAVGFKA